MKAIVLSLLVVAWRVCRRGLCRLRSLARLAAGESRSAGRQSAPAPRLPSVCYHLD